MTAAVRRWRLGFARSVGAVMAVALLSACSSNPEPGPLPHSSTPVQATTGTPSPASDPAPSPDGPPTLPAAARGNGPRSAKAFVRYYIATINYAAASGDMRPASGLAAASCDSCAAMLEKIHGVYQAGGYFRGDGWAVTHVKYQPLQRRKRPVLSVEIRLAPQTMVARAGATARHFPAGENALTIRLVRRMPAWQVAEVERLR